MVYWKLAPYKNQLSPRYYAIANRIEKSIDDSKTVGNWPKVIQENQIAWRCLTASDKLDEVMKTYTIQGIPLAYHVSKSGSFKEVHLQNAKERAALIQTVLTK